MGRVDCDLIVIGAGIAGVSTACELGSDRSVLVLDQEATPAFHSTGRSAALFLESYGNGPIRALTTGSRDALLDPPDFFDRPLLTPRPMLQFARPGRGDAVRDMFASVRGLAPDVELLSPTDAVALFPALRVEAVEIALHEPGSMEIDVHAVHQGFLRGLRQRGGEVRTSSAVSAMVRDGDVWEVTTTSGDVHRAPAVVNAAGAWADAVAAIAGARAIGLSPRRRTVFMVACPDDLTGATIPTVSDIDESFYLKPEGAQLLCSPADETPVDPHDARPDELEIARALDVIAECTTIGARHVRSSWAGLRSFVADRTPVVGPDPDVPGLFWCAGQGGYGIQTCAAMARITAAAVRGETVPAYLATLGVSFDDLSPARAALRTP
ncbi:NAD(P)/FAD-dependent oxidoreductase [Williamsia sp. M5A3_1d]